MRKGPDERRQLTKGQKKKKEAEGDESEDKNMIECTKWKKIR
jgi:hypothetical protein